MSVVSSTLLRWFRRSIGLQSGLWHLTFDGSIGLCGTDLRDRQGSEQVPLTIGPPTDGPICARCQDDVRRRLAL